MLILAATVKVAQNEITIIDSYNLVLAGRRAYSWLRIACAGPYIYTY